MPTIYGKSGFVTKTVFSTLSILLLILSSFSQIFGQSNDQYKADRDRAVALCEKNLFVEALPILENLYSTKPDDLMVIEKLGQALATLGILQTNPESKKQMLARAHRMGERAKELGDNTDVVNLLLSIPADGVLPDNPHADDSEAKMTLDRAEKAFATGDMDTALTNYKKALELDPKLYEAALYAGDACFRMQKFDEAGDWFSKAIAINPNRETAYRYWGDALTRSGKTTDARIKFIEAIVAEPYSGLVWTGLGNWAKYTKVQITPPPIKVPKVNITKNDKGEITLNIDVTDPTKGPDPWFTYSLTKTLWMSGDRFKKAFPNEKEYRHSLAEEVDALGMVADTAAKDMKDGKAKDTDDSLKALIQLKEQGMLEPFILFFMADKGIAADYEGYRAQHRDKLILYLKQMVPEPK